MSTHQLPIQEGDRVEIQGRQGVALVECIREIGDRVAVLFRLTGSTQEEWQELYLSREEVSQKIRRVPPWWERFGKACISWEEFVLYVEAHRLRRAYWYDPHYATRASQVDLLPHQVEGV